MPNPPPIINSRRFQESVWGSGRGGGAMGGGKSLIGLHKEKCLEKGGYVPTFGGLAVGMLQIGRNVGRGGSVCTGVLGQKYGHQP